MSLFERIREKRINLTEQSFTDRQKSDMKKLLNKNFGSKEKAKATAGEVIKDTAKKDVERYFAKSKSKSKGGGATTGGTKPIKQSEVSKKAKEYTQKIDKMRRAADRSVKKQYPDSSSLQAMKSDIDTRKLIKKAGGTGDIGFTAPDRPRKIQKRITRATKQGTPDPFDIDTSKASKDVAKDFGTKPVKGGLDMGKSKIPRKITKKFPLTKPSDIKLPKSYQKFDRDLQDFKDRDKATMRTGKSSSKVKVSGGENLTRQDVGMAPKSTPKPKTTNVFKKVSKATSGKGVTNSKGIGNKYRKNPALRDARIQADRDAAMGGGKKPPKPPTKKGGALVPPEPDARPKRVVSKQTRDLLSKQGKFAKSGLGKGIKKNLPQVYKGLKTLGPGGRALVKKGGLGGVAVAGLLASPPVRKFAKGALTGAGIGFLAGNKKQQKLVTGPNVNVRKKFSLSPGEKGGFSTSKS